MTSELTEALAERYAAKVSDLRNNVATVIKGKDDVIDLAIICLMAEGHLLIEDVPGTGKTQLARSLSDSIDAIWTRVQFTPDLLPSDVTGVTIYDQAAKEFTFHRGPIFGNIVLADEINRASPRTQSALLEVMEERQVTVDGVANPVPRPFMVIATQNPIDMDGTYPLPEAQLDRFLIRTSMGYPDTSAELEILLGQNSVDPHNKIRSVLTVDEAASMVSLVPRVHIDHAVADYLLRIVTATRASNDIDLPVSPRGSVSLLRAARSRALSKGRSFVTPEDVRALAGHVLAHRIVLTAQASLAGNRVADVLDRLIEQIPVPNRGVARPA